MEWKRLWFSRWQDALFFVIILLLVLSYWHDTQSYRKVYEDPCAYCPRCVAVPLPLTANVSWGNLSGDWDVREEPNVTVS